MDMSVKLNLSYPAPIAPKADKAPEKPQAVGDVPAVKTKDSESEDLKVAVKEIQDFVQTLKRNLEFSIDDSTHKVVVKVIASDSGEVIRQIPSETALELAKSLSDASSLLFDAKV